MSMLVYNSVFQTSVTFIYGMPHVTKRKNVSNEFQILNLGEIERWHQNRYQGEKDGSLQNTTQMLKFKLKISFERVCVKIVK